MSKTKKVWIIGLKSLGYIWLTLAILLILTGIIGVWMQEGFGGVRRLLSPFNVINYIVTVLTLAPGGVALILAKRLEQRNNI